MKTAFFLILIALLILPPVVTVRIMVGRERRRLRERQAGAAPGPDEG
ncbi:MAG TPA: hypothetical protein VGF77_04390 [Allosphingosinicella sp.]|jgi:hypothetical protein